MGPEQGWVLTPPTQTPTNARDCTSSCWWSGRPSRDEDQLRYVAGVQMFLFPTFDSTRILGVEDSSCALGRKDHDMSLRALSGPIALTLPSSRTNLRQLGLTTPMLLARHCECQPNGSNLSWLSRTRLHGCPASPCSWDYVRQGAIAWWLISTSTRDMYECVPCTIPEVRKESMKNQCGPSFLQYFFRTTPTLFIFI
jgi:hypothetical protein